MGRAVERWIADDGTEFDNKRDMLLHEMTVLDEKEIDYFVNHVIETSVKRASEYKKLLITWQKHVRSQELDKPTLPELKEALELPLNPL